MVEGMSQDSTAGPVVVSVAASTTHTFSKTTMSAVELVEGIGVVGDAHSGATVKHRSRVRRDPTQPNRRQVHLIHAELFDDLRSAEFEVGPGELGENITTRGINLLALPTGTLLALGDDAVIEITGLRNPCHQIDDFQHGLLKQVVGRDADGGVVRKAGVMSVVRAGGVVRPGDSVTVTLPAEPHHALVPV